MNAQRTQLLALLDQYHQLGIAQQVDYDKFYLYSLITHSTAIEGSTVTEVENQLLFDDDLPARGRSMQELLMNLDLRRAYEQSRRWAALHIDITPDRLRELAALVMRNTGATYNTLVGSFDAAAGDLRLVNVTAGAGGASYLHYLKVPARLDAFCTWLNAERKKLLAQGDAVQQYALSFEAHLRLVTIHPWVDGNGRMARLLMNHLQWECGLLPSKVDHHNKAAYIEALVAARQTESPQPFLDFMFEEHIGNLRDEIDTFRQSQEG